MTAQFSNTICYDGRTWIISKVFGRSLFDPREHSLNPIAFNTACHRGFICSFAITDRQLVLDELIIGMTSLDVLRIVRMAFGDGILLNVLEVSTDATGGRKPLPGQT